MLKIAICDDEAHARAEIQNFLVRLQSDYDIRFHISLFEDGNELCKHMQQNPFDLIYLDYSMKIITGLEVARKIRAAGYNDAKIIFVSSYDSYIKDLFPLGILGFLDKPCAFESFKRSFHFAYREIFNHESKIFTYTAKSEKKFAFIKDIVYFETGAHSTILHLANRPPIEFRSSFNDVWKEMQQFECFAMPTRSFIINFRYAESVSKTAITIPGKIIPIGRTHKKETEDRYSSYLEILCTGGDV